MSATSTMTAAGPIALDVPCYSLFLGSQHTVLCLVSQIVFLSCS